MTDLKQVNNDLSRLHRFEDDELPVWLAAGFEAGTIYAAKVLEWRAQHLCEDAETAGAPEQAALYALANQCAYLSAGLVNGHCTARYTGPNTPGARLRLESYTLAMRPETVDAFELLFGEHAIVRRPVAWETN